MMCSAAPPDPLPAARPGIEAAFRAALAESLASLAVADVNLLAFHHDRGLSLDQLARLLGTSPGALARQVARLHARVLRDLRHALAPRVEPAQLDRVLGLARDRLGHAIASVLRRST